MVQKLLNIYPAAYNKQVLHLECGNSHIAFMVVDAESNGISGFEYFSWQENEGSCTNILNQVHNQSKILPHFTNAASICWCLEEFLAIPTPYMIANEEEAFITSIFGTKYDQVVTHLSNEDQHIIYRVPADWQMAIEQLLAIETATHKFQYFFEKQLPPVNPTIQIYFYEQQFLLACNYGKHHFIKICTYQKSEDVLYHLFNTIHQLNIENKLAVQLLISGLVEKESQVYNDMVQYFAHISFQATETYHFKNEDFLAYPSHYFTPFFKQLV